MYTYTPTHRFLVLSAVSSAPFNPANKFLVLSPTESGPDPRIYDEQAVAESSSTGEISPKMVPKSHRSDSSSSVSSMESQSDILPSGFLYLGHTSRRYSTISQ
ncbi:uncharacterized protein N7483_006682 [Penicillium malachiteum]|uniref:uncharacterized protein n=1 Tax=Penicillium malachiteum TaxID=1324776 RepID=UPI0025499347|nr:uncharacterized protein N7483_006682 [Penicillium malachiteum]KAJ5725325.1 hypothetical protein N7483_006682 [Penicillium malachiteum]